jgi:hypothetical protein
MEAVRGHRRGATAEGHEPARHPQADIMIMVDSYTKSARWLLDDRSSKSLHRLLAILDPQMRYAQVVSDQTA